MTKTKAITARRAKTTETTERKTTPGLKRLRKAANAEAIRSAVLDDQQNGRAEALAKIEAEKALQTPTDAPAPAPAPDAPADAETPPAPAAAKPKARFARGVAIEPTPIPTPAPTMEGMSAKNAALYLAAAQGVMPTPPDFSKPSYASDRPRLAKLVELANAGDIEGLRSFAIKVYYSGAQALDRYRQMAVIALEARQAERAAA